MKCPFCGNPDSKVVDSRPDKGGTSSGGAANANHAPNDSPHTNAPKRCFPWYAKRTAAASLFDRMKIVAGIKKACEKRPISMDEIERLVDRLEGVLQESSEREISTTTIGEWIMKELHDGRGRYVRFASVYRSFRDIGEFMQELQELLKK